MEKKEAVISCFNTSTYLDLSFFFEGIFHPGNPVIKSFIDSSSAAKEGMKKEQFRFSNQKEDEWLNFPGFSLPLSQQ